MLNIDEFTKRLEKIFDYYSISASGFADKIGVQRSSLSHLLSGRNKPSLEFILKIVDVFPEVDLYWILNGKGTFPKTITPPPPPVEKKSIPQTTPKVIQETLFDTTTDYPTIEPTPIKNPVFEKKQDSISNTATIEGSLEIEKIVFFYKNGTFKTYQPQ